MAAKDVLFANDARQKNAERCELTGGCSKSDTWS